MATANSLNGSSAAAPPEGETAPPAEDAGSVQPQAVEAAGAQAPLSLEQQLQQAGLEVLGSCQKMSGRGPALLQHSALLEDFTMKELDTLGEAMLLIRAKPGQVLIAEGDVGDWLLLLLSGTVDVTKTTPATDAGDPEPAGSQSRLGVTTEGAVLGEMSMFDRDVRYATCAAIDAVEAAVLSRAAIGQLIRQHPGVGAKLMVKITQLLAQRLRNTSNRMIRLLQKK